MTTLTTARLPRRVRRPALLGALAAETLDLWTLPSRRVLAAVAVILIAGSGLLRSLSLLSQLTDPRFAGQQIVGAPLEFVDSVLWAQIIVAVIAVLAVTGEYGSGQVRLTLLALPTRLPWLLGKALVLAATGFGIGVLGAAGSLALSAAILPGSEVIYTLDLAVAAELTVKSGLYLAAIAALSVGLATIVRHAVAGLVAVLGLFIVIPPVLSSIPGIVVLADLTPTIAGRRLLSDFASTLELGPWEGYGVLGLWTLLTLAVAAVLLAARDV